jgi:16S rRNA (cytosine967-C5)-methyltransferase
MTVPPTRFNSRDVDPALASRSAMLAVLQACLDRRQALDETLAREPRLTGLPPRDRAFVRLVVATALRHLGEIDLVLSALVERPLQGPNRAAQQVLRLGAAQLLFLGTPAHAAVDTSVRVIVEAGLPHLKGLTNAVLRRLARDGRALLADRDATRLNTPPWLWDSWLDAYGEAATRAIAEAHRAEAPLDITARADAEGWAQRLQGELLPVGTIRRPSGGAIAELPGFVEGAWWVQDAAASLPARLLGEVAGKRVADLCAAPGGKTLQLAAGGARVTAVDISPGRMGRLRENLARVDLAAETVTADAAKWTPTERFDAILIDAPCSGTGTLRRHPDIAWLKSQDDVRRLSVAQDRLLMHAVELLKPGGVMIYAVCSLQPEEGPARVEAALARGAPLARVPVRPCELPGLPDALTELGDVRTLPSMWPERGGIDGFYIARLVRRIAGLTRS